MNYLQRLPLIPTIIVALAIAVMIALGFWQLGRADEKAELLARYAAAGDNQELVAWPGEDKDALKQRYPKGVDVIYDPVGGDVFAQSLRCIAPEGRIMPVGFAGGTIQQIPANILLVKNLSVLGFYWGGYAKIKPSVLTDSFAELIKWYVAGKLKPHVSHVLPLDQANEALDLLRTRKATGKVIVRVS